MSKLINNISDEEYEKLDGINFSKLKHFLDSPYHFKKNMEKTEDDEDKTALRIGLAVHCLALQPHLFNDKFAVMIECDRRTKEGKQMWAEFIANNENKMCLSIKEFGTAMKCYESIKHNKYFNAVSSMNDEVFFEAGGSMELFGSKIKGRIDLFNKSKNVVLDIKTCSKIPTIDNIRNAIYQNKYHMQAYFYKSIVNSVFDCNPKFVFLFVDKKNFNAIGLAEVGPEFFNRAEEELNRALCRFENCKQNGLWPAFPHSEEPFIIDAHSSSLPQIDVDNEWFEGDIVV